MRVKKVTVISYNLKISNKCIYIFCTNIIILHEDLLDLVTIRSSIQGGKKEYRNFI